MGMHTTIPTEFAIRAERQRWFARNDAEQVLDWLEEDGHRFIGMDVAEKHGEQGWMLLPDRLDLSRQTDNFEAVRRGRDFLRDYDGDGRMFEPVWQERT